MSLVLWVKTELEYFCKGIAEEIINALAKAEALRVASRSSAFQFVPQGRSISGHCEPAQKAHSIQFSGLAQLLTSALALSADYFFISVVQTASVPGILYWRSPAEIPFAGSR